MKASGFISWILSNYCTFLIFFTIPIQITHLDFLYCINDFKLQDAILPKKWFSHTKFFRENHILEVVKISPRSSENVT